MNQIRRQKASGSWVRERRKRNEKEAEEEGERRSLLIGSDRARHRRLWSSPIQLQRGTKGSGSGQRSERGWVENLRCGFFHCQRVGAASEKQKKKKKKKKKRERLAGHWNPASCTCFGVQHVSDTDMMPKMACLCNVDVVAIGFLLWTQVINNNHINLFFLLWTWVINML